MSATDFNPRSPHGERRDQSFLNQQFGISIHAPRTGSDPCRGGYRQLRRISIHAPRTGSDAETQNVIFTCCVFQSTLPARGATLDTKQLLTLGQFQSTLPARGATTNKSPMPPTCAHFNPRSPHGERPAEAEKKDQKNLISIHAPRTGSDSLSTSGTRATRNFNPRSPHGERQPRVGSHFMIWIFQSTLPARGATRRRGIGTITVSIFQSTLPARGATKNAQPARMKG